MSGNTQEAANAGADATAPLMGLIDINKIDTDAILGFLTVHGVKMLTALAIFIIGKWIIKRIVNVLKGTMGRANVDPTLIGFLGNIMFGVGVAFVVIAALSQMGIETTSLAAVIGAAGLAIGLALQGSLANFASGVLIILFRPFKSGDYVEIAGDGGTVEEISIFTTQLTTPDNKHMIIPNGNITSEVIINYSAKPTRRLDLVVGVAYDADLNKTQELLRKIISEEPRILPEPAPRVEVLELGDSSVNFAFRPWVDTAEYWNVRFDILKKIKIELDNAGIGIPFPQRDVHLFFDDAEGMAKGLSGNGKKKAA
jgi:small conductance mechanosensitive channel